MGQSRRPRPPLRGPDERNALAVRHLGLARMAARRFLRLRPGAEAQYPLDEAEADGYLGLLRAAELFDPARGCAFGTYAMPWIVQRMMSGLRRSEVVKAPEERKRTAALPSVLSADWQDRRFTDDGPADRAPPAEEALARREEAERVRAWAAALLTDRQRHALLLCVERGWTLARAGRSLGMARQRVHQLRNAALEALRERASREGMA